MTLTVNSPTRLLVHLGFGGFRRQVEAALAEIVPFVLNSDLGQMTEDVLHLGVTT